MPGGHNRFGSRDERSYTESIGFLLAFALASVALIMWGTLAPKALCSTDQTFTMDDLARRRFVAANGIVSDFTLSRPSFGSTMRGYAGYDISTVFPLLGQLSPGTFEDLPGDVSGVLGQCVSDRVTAENFIESWMANSTLYRGDLDVFPERCPFPQSPQIGGAVCMVADWPQFVSNKVGTLRLNATDVSARHGSPTTSWVIIDDLIYDVSLYVTYATDPVVNNDTVDSTRVLRESAAFLPKSLSQLFIDKAGKDISDDFRKLDIDTAFYKQCMGDLFLRGTTLDTKSPFACANTNIVAWVTFGLYFLVLFSRLAMAEVYAQVRARKAVLTVAGSSDDLLPPPADAPPGSSSGDSPAAGPTGQGRTSPRGGFWSRLRGHMLPLSLRRAGGRKQRTAGDSPVDERRLEAGDRRKSGGLGGTLAKCLVVVPCFQETIETLTRTLQGIARSAHADSHTVLWIINDGNPEVLSAIIRILAHSGHTSDPKFYAAYSVDSSSNSYGLARVYAGFYECGRHRIPYVVTAKELYHGRVDSLMMVLSFFRSISSSPRAGDAGSDSGGAQPQTIFLEEEVEARMALLGHPPATIDYCLLLDGSIQIDPLAITQFVARMEANAEVIALSGTLYPAGRPSSLLQILQFFEFYLRHFVSPICDSLSNVTCPLNQLFTMYRVRIETGACCLGNDDFMASMDKLMKSSVRYRHRTWPGNDCLLVPRLVRQFPQHRWAFEPNGRAEVELAAHVMAAYDPYERQWFRTRLVTLFDILRGRMLKRTLPIMLGHLVFPFAVPAATCMLYLEIVISMFGDNPAVVVSELTAGFIAVTMVLLLVSRRWQLAIYFLVYSAIAVPFYCVWIPVTSFFSMNRIWYPPEQLEAQLATAEAQIQPPENFEEIKNSYLRRFHPARHGRRRHRSRHRNRSTSSQSSGGGGGGAHFAAENADASSDSDPEIVENPFGSPRRSYARAGGDGHGLGLHLPEQRPVPDPAQVEVGSSLMADARTALRQSLVDGPLSVVPDSAEFYSLCEQALGELIHKHPRSTVTELAVAVSRAADEILCASPAPPVAPPAPSEAISPLPTLLPAMAQAQASVSSLDKERRRQQAQDDASEEATEYRRAHTEAEAEGQETEELAPEVERLDPHSVPGLYPEFDIEEQAGEEGDDSWYVDPAFAEREMAEAVPLWQRRAAANLGQQASDALPAMDGSMFDLCRATLQEDGEVAVLDVGDRCDWTQYMMVVKARNTRHMRAMGERLLMAIKGRNQGQGTPGATRVDGRESDDWMVVDMGRFVVHIMTPEAHETYDLESLWTAPPPEHENAEPSDERSDGPQHEPPQEDPPGKP
ncbi:hypothetical protein H4R21_001120 [Coemansia helicoidea]|uniref:Uncharacterized protein n=1 Tax=Coemansia helicoidea TaxID=1286919 RepID=A0ACC1LD95_9FUNG|nr:hypothetical protein H4R21_001120 [Coemansia helicoidea]